MLLSGEPGIGKSRLVRTITARLETAAADLYATPWRTFRFVTLPLLWLGLLLSLVPVFAAPTQAILGAVVGYLLGQAGAFDVVLMDVQMPVMDGYAATRAIRAWEVAMQRLPTPVIALTANAVKEDMERSLAAGCDDHLTKPIKKRVLLDALRERLARAA